MTIRGLLATVSAVAVGWTLAPAPVAADFPERPIRLIVPFGQGGSSGNAARAIQQAISANDLLPVPIAITYVPGAAGTIGARQIKDAEPDGHNILIWHIAANGAKVMGNVDFGPFDFEPFFGDGESCFLFIGREDLEYETLDELLQAAADEPETIISADNLGGANHIASVLVETQVPGAAFRHVQFGGTAETYPALLGGHADVNASSTSAVTSTTTRGLRVYGYLADERHPNFPDVPTFEEQGYDLTFCNFNWWFAPKDTPPDRLEYLADVWEQAWQTDEMRQFAESFGVGTRTLRGDELIEAIRRQGEALEAIGPRLRGTAGD